MTSITLFWRPGTCARIIYVALEEIGEPFEVQTLNAFKGDMQSAEYRAVNPKGKVPALLFDDWVITENPVILRVLDRRFRQARLLPAGDERTETAAAEMMAWFASGLHPAVARHRFPGRFTTSEDPAEWQGIRLHAREELAAAFAILEQRLQTRDWLFDDWSIVDVYMLYLWWRAVGSGMDPSPFPRCTDHGRRCEARPTVAEVLDRDAAEFARMEAEGWVPSDWEPHYAGRIAPELIAHV